MLKEDVRDSIQTPAQSFQFIPAPNDPNIVEDSSKVSKAVVLRDDLDKSVEEQSDEDVDEATLDYLYWKKN